jgi:hypothetical protein
LCWFGQDHFVGEKEKRQMQQQSRFGMVIGCAAVVLFWCARTSQGQITNVINSDVEGFFGANNDAAQLSEGPLTPPWAAVGPLVLPHGPTGLPNIPTLFTGFPTPNPPTNPPITPNIPFPAPAGHSHGFSALGTVADYHLYGGFAGTGNYTRNAYVGLGNSTGQIGMDLIQPSSAIGYAYEEEEFSIDYGVNPAGGLAAGAPLGNRYYVVAGSFLPGLTHGAEFGADVEYWWIPTVVNTGTGVITSYGTPVSLGSLEYDKYIAPVTGPFAYAVPDTYASPYLLGVAAGQTGILDLTGDMYLYGDPVDLSVSVVVPEPASLSLLALGSLGLLVRRRKA